MASSVEGYPFDINVPEFIQEKFDLLRHQERQIVALESQLKELKEQHAELQAQLLPYRTIDKTETSEEAPINRYPDEILILIWWQLFGGEYAGWDWGHPSIRRLLFVCKRWFCLLMNTPTLWTRIAICNPWTLFHPSGGESRVPYISTCIQRSKGAALDVRLDLKDLPSRSRYIKQQIFKLLFSICDEDEKSAIENHVWKWNTDFNSNIFENQFEQALECLIGVNGVTQRWNRLSLVLPLSYELATRIWTKLGSSFPNLTTLEIISASTRWARDEQVLQNPLNLPMAKQLRLELPYGAFSITALNPSPDVLESLELSTDLAFSNTAELSLFKNLQALELTCYEPSGATHSWSDYVDFPYIYFPRLDTLSFIILRNHFRAPDLNLPSLRTLKLESKFPNYRFPKLSVRHINWSMFWIPQDAGKGGLLETKIREIVGLSPVLETLTIQKGDKDEVLRVVAQMKRERTARLPSKILIEKLGHQPEAIDILN